MDIQTVFEYFRTVSDLVTGIIAFLPQLFGFLPGEILVIFMATISIASIYRIMGWGG